MKIYDIIETSVMRSITVKDDIATANSKLVKATTPAPSNLREIKALIKLEHRALVDDSVIEAIRDVKRDAVKLFDERIYGELRSECRDVIFKMHGHMMDNADFDGLELLRQLKDIINNPR